MRSLAKKFNIVRGEKQTRQQSETERIQASWRTWVGPLGKQWTPIEIEGDNPLPTDAILRNSYRLTDEEM